MQNNNEIGKLYRSIMETLNASVPENWQSIYLYASVLYGRTGEMYFYYYPKRLIKSKPINCYEIADKFGIDEIAYNKNLDKIYSYLKALNNLMYNKWTNVTIIMKDNFFTIEYHFDDLLHSKYNDEQRRVIWSHKYLKTPIESLKEKDRELIENYKDECMIRPMTYTEVIDKNYNDSGIKKNGFESQENTYIPERKSDIKNPFLKF